MLMDLHPSMKVSIMQSDNFLICKFIKIVFLNGPSPGLYLIYFRLFEQTLQFLQQINVKNVHAVYGAGVRTHNLWNMSLLP